MCAFLVNCLRRALKKHLNLWGISNIHFYTLFSEFCILIEESS